MKTFMLGLLSAALIGGPGEIVRGARPDSQPFVETFGSSNDETIHAVIRAANGDFVVTGGYQKTPTDRQVLLARFNAEGQMIWRNTWGVAGASVDEEGNGVVETQEGDLIVVGYTRYQNDGLDFLCSKFTGLGNHLWTKTWWGGTGDDDELTAVIRSTDGTIWATGYTRSWSPLDVSKLVMLKISSSGNLTCCRAWRNGWNLSGADLAQVFNTDGICVTGRVESLYGSEILLAKFSLQPSFLWADRIGGMNAQEGNALVRTSDECLALTGPVTYFDGVYMSEGGFLIKTDPNAAVSWSRLFGGLGPYGYRRVEACKETSDQQLLVAGTHRFSPGGDYQQYAFLTKIGLDGTTTWSRGFEAGDEARAESVTEFYDGGYLLAGETLAPGIGGTDGFLLSCTPPGESCVSWLTGPDPSSWTPTQHSILLLSSATVSIEAVPRTIALDAATMAVTPICPLPGACCAPTGVCTLTFAADCLPPDLWQGEGTCCAPGLCPLPPDGLVAYWRFDEGEGTVVHDSTSLGFNGDVRGAAWANGVIDWALQFDGSNDYVQFSNPVLNQPPYSFCFWIDPGEAVAGRYILANGGETASRNGIAFVVEDNQVVGVFMKPLDSGSSLGGWVTAPLPTDGPIPPWVFVVATWDGTSAVNSIKLYINGSLAASSTPTAYSRSPGEHNLRLGAPSDAVHLCFAGRLDEIRVFARTLSAAEIEAIDFWVTSGAKDPFPPYPTDEPAILSIEPNPSGGNGTEILLACPKNVAPEVTIHEVSGRLVRTLSPGGNAGGLVHVRWDGRSTDGTSAASGVYFVRARTGGGVRQQRLVVVR